MLLTRSVTSRPPFPREELAPAEGQDEVAATDPDMKEFRQHASRCGIFKKH